MKRRRKLSLILALIMMLSLAACGSGGAEVETDDKTASQEQQNEIVYKRSDMGNKVNSPNDIYYLVENPITIIEVNAFPNGETRPEDYPDPWTYCEMSEEDKADYIEEYARFDGAYLQISGLKDTEVEAKINRKLKEHFVEYASFIPPYRGVRLLIGEDPQEPDAKYYYPSVRMHSVGNLNNILSVSVSAYKQYVDVNGEMHEWGEPVYHYFGYYEPLNIDLNTGEEIPLDALFCDDIDPFDYVNGKIKEALREGEADEEGYYPGETVKLAGKFNGIKPEQKYTIGPSGVSLVFDYDTPELNAASTSYSMLILPYEDVFAATSRFYNPHKNIYISEEEPLKMFPYQYELKQIPITDESYQIDNIWVYLFANAYDITPDVIKNQLRDFMAVTEEDVREALSPEYEEALLMHDPLNSVDANFQRNASTSIFGPYVNVHRSENRYVAEYGNGPTTQYLSDYTEWNEVYDVRTLDEDNPQPLTLADFFYEDVDYEKMIKEAMKAGVMESISYENPEEDVMAVLLNDEVFPAYIDALYEDITGFSVGQKHLYLNFEDSNAVFCESYGVETVDDIPYGWRYAYGAYNLSYKALGYDNINIFD